MKGFYSFIIWSLFSITGLAQERLVLNNDAYLVMSNNSYLVIDNSNANAITEDGTGGRIVSEAEGNKVRWMLGTASGTYTLPWNSDPGTSNTEIPLTFIVSSAGVGGASQYVDFATWEAAATTSAANTPWATGVSNMDLGGADNQAKVLDRWWWLGATNYTTKPSVRMTFTYDDGANELGGSNTITEANLQAQRWGGSWSRYKLWGTVNVATNEVVIGASETIADADFFDAWVLSDNASPLPVTWLDFDVTCKSLSVELQWSTGTEINNDYFTIEKSYDGVDYFEIGTLNGAGNSNFVNTYSFTDYELINQSAYYRLKQVDFNGAFEYSKVIVSLNCAAEMDISLYPNPFNDAITIQLPTQNEQEYHIEIKDYLGRIILREIITNNSGSSHQLDLSSLASKSVYVISINNKQKIVLHQKLIRM
jgi:hypothetical protein